MEKQLAGVIARMAALGASKQRGTPALLRDIAIGLGFLVFVLTWTGGGPGAIDLLVMLAYSSLFVLYRWPVAGLAVASVTGLYFPFYFGSSTVVLFVPLLLLIYLTAVSGEPLLRLWSLLLVGGTAVTASLGGTVYLGGSILYLGVTFVLCAGLLGLPWIAGVLIYAKQQKRAASRLANEALERTDILKGEVSLEHERNRVARDVHDIVAHSLAVVIAQADGARYAARKSPEAVDAALEAIAGTARLALVDVRALLTELRHTQEPGPQPGLTELNGLVRGFRESGMRIDWTSYGAALPTTESAELAVYRIVQEGLTNALRHGSREHAVDLEFDWSDSSLSVTITNDLTGAMVSPNSAGHGVPGMRERASLAGGTFAAGAGTNGRFRVRATLPADRSLPTAPIPTAPLASTVPAPAPAPAPPAALPRDPIEIVPA